MSLCKNLVSIAALAGTLAACGGINGKDNGKKADEVDTGFVGTWVSAPTPQKALGIIPIACEINELVFPVTIGDVTKTVHRFDDTGCGSALYDQAIAGTYSIVPGSQVAGAENLNINIHNITITPVSDAAAAKMNEGKFCGATDWAVKAAKDVTGLDCGGKKFNDGDVVFDLAQRNGNSLVLGKASFFNDGTSAAERPTALDTEHPLLKK